MTNKNTCVNSDNVVTILKIWFLLSLLLTVFVVRGLLGNPTELFYQGMTIICLMSTGAPIYTWIKIRRIG